VAYVTDSPVGTSPLEAVLLGLLLVALSGVGLLWAAGVLVGAILDAVLPGDVGAGVASVVQSFPKVLRAGRLRAGGARWATVADLRQAGLLIRDQSQPHAVQEQPKLADAPE